MPIGRGLPFLRWASTWRKYMNCSLGLDLEGIPVERLSRFYID
jgi:hypothetical protein